MRNCSRCGELLEDDAFYFVSKKLGTRRGQCKACMAELKSDQKNPAWEPTCSRCGIIRPRSGPGRRLCTACFEDVYDEEDRRENGSHRLKLKPCSACGAHRLRQDHFKGSTLCPICRSVNQGRRKRLKMYFNMSPREYVQLLEEQRNRCGICSRRFTKALPPHVDHSHADPPFIRGLLCGGCNTLLGLAKDRPERLQAAMAFLAAPPAQGLFPGRQATELGNRDSWETFRPLRRAA